MSSKKLYVGNLSYSTKSEGLEALFVAHGEVVSANVIVDRDTGRSKGFGFVEYGTAEEAAAAKEAVDGAELDGRALRVDFARERPPRDAGYGSGGGYGAGAGGGYGGGRGY